MQKEVRIVKNIIPKAGESDGFSGFMPVSTIMITCMGKDGRPNIIPVIGWGFLCRFPVKLGVAICQGEYTENYFKRYSHHLIEESGEFVVNIPHEGLRDAIDYCGSHSMREGVDKFAATGLTPGKPAIIKVPIIEECPVNYECRVTETVHLGSHDLFIGEVVAVHQWPVLKEDIDENLMTYLLDGRERRMKLVWDTLPKLEYVNSSGWC